MSERALDAPAVSAGAERLSLARRTARALFGAPQSAAGTLIVLFFLTLAIFGPALAPYGGNDQSSAPRLPPTNSPAAVVRAVRADPAALLDLHTYAPGAHPFGTDTLGRDVLSRVILGTRSIFVVAGLGSAIAVAIGTFVGLGIGYRGGWLDELAGRIVDALLALPALLIALVTLGVLRQMAFAPGSLQAALAERSVLLVIALVYAPIVARVVRGVTLEVKTRTFVQAAQIRGETWPYLLFREIFPSVAPTLLVEASLRFSYAIFLVASLGFLGVGVPPPTPDWGRMVAENQGGYYQLTPWALEYPAAAIVLLVVGVNLMSDGVKRALQRGG